MVVLVVCDYVENKTPDELQLIKIPCCSTSKPQEAPAMYMTQHFQNARSISKEKPYGPADTWNGFEFNKKPGGCIDYIFLSANKKLSVKKFDTITDSYDMKYPSDHFPILATLELNK